MDDQQELFQSAAFAFVCCGVGIVNQSLSEARVDPLGRHAGCKLLGSEFG